MTTFDLVTFYQFNLISSKYRSYLGNACCPTMVEEMNEIRELYHNSGSIRDVLEKCVCNRHGHQYCIPTSAIEEAVNKLMDSQLVCAKLKKGKPLINKEGKLSEGFSDFEDLYDFVNSVIGGIKGIGPLTVYDTAKRIGHLFENPIYPEKYVYLSAGALEGAKKLLNRKKLSFREPVTIYVPYFGTYPSIFIEDILCIFKDEFNPLNLTLKNTNAALLAKCGWVFLTGNTVTVSEI